MRPLPSAPFVCLQCRSALRMRARPQARVQGLTTTARPLLAAADSRLARLADSSRRPLPTPSTSSLLSAPTARLLSATAAARADVKTDLPDVGGPAPSALRPATNLHPNVDIKHIRQNPALHEQNCLDRNYKAQAAYPARIVDLFARWQAVQRDAKGLRGRSKELHRQIASAKDPQDKQRALEEARLAKQSLSAFEADESRLSAEIESLALAIPNLTSDETPRGDEAVILSYINHDADADPAATGSSANPAAVTGEPRSHVDIGTELGLLDFASAGTSSGWGWYYLMNEGAQLEQALVAYTLAVVTRHGWGQVAPPSVVYSHIAAACGFQPRDQSGEQQIYTLHQSAADAARGRPEHCLAGTAEIPLAGMKANAVLDESETPLRHVAVSRCYRAEAGARGADTKGLYRVHEFTKVEMFAWAPPPPGGSGSGSDAGDIAAELFDEMLDIQTEILGSLGLACRVLEMPSADLGASAARKCDIEAFFPSRRSHADSAGWGEVTSASMCTDYQTRRLNTRLRADSAAGQLLYPWTLNGTALAVPRVLAALLEVGWDEADRSVAIPGVLRPWMGGKHKIGGGGGGGGGSRPAGEEEPAAGA